MVETTCRIDYAKLAKIFPDPKDRSVIIDAIEFFVKHLGIDGAARELNFDPRRFRKDAPTGTCNNDKNCAKTFWIVFMGKGDKKKRNLAAVLTTIAHELIHVKQYLFDNLYEEFELNQKAGDKKVPYRETWWEKEAWEGQEPLMLKFIEHIGTK